jgi:hypothetical protein
MLKPVQNPQKVPGFVEGIMVVYYQGLDALNEGGLKSILRPRFFWKRKATPVEMDLCHLFISRYSQRSKLLVHSA